LQTTLLSLAIALIAALLAALIGPFFIDWNQYRTAFETEASRLSGLEVRVRGGIDMRFLPVPSLVLNDVNVGPQGGEARLHAATLRLVLGLGALVRGEVRATDMLVDEPEFGIGLDASGRVDWPRMPVGFDPDAVSIERLRVQNGRVTLTDAASASKVVLQNLDFNGDMRSLLGPFKGEGAFVVNGYHQPFRLSTGRVTDGSLRLRLSTDPIDRPMMAETDGIIAWERGEPRFDGTLTITRRAATVRAGGEALLIEPWRATTKMKATPAAALLEQVEFQYGPEERAIKLTGTANVKLGGRPQIEGALSARQLDVDRLVGTLDGPTRSPASVAKAFAETFGAMQPGLPVSIALSVDSLTLGGANLQTVGLDLRNAGEAWNLERLDFRAPGISQISASGRVDITTGSPGFAGAVKLESSDPKTLLAWLDGRANTAPGQMKPWHLRGDVTLSSDRIAIERLRTELDREAIQGRLIYSWSDAKRPARLEASLNSPELDLDSLFAFGKAALAGTTLEPPREISLALELGRARLADMEARNASGRLLWDGNGLQVERLSVGDFGGASFVANGRIDTSNAQPRGNVSLDLDARSLAGVSALAAKYFPEHAGRIQQIAGRISNAKLQAILDVGDVPQSSGSARTRAKLELKGRAGAMRVALTALSSGAPAAFSTDFGNLRATDLKFDMRLDSEDGSVLASVLGLDQLVAVDKRAGQLSFTANGPAGGDLRFESRIAAGGLEASAQGNVRPFTDEALAANFDLNLLNANLAPLRQKLGGSQPLPLALKSKIAIAGTTISLQDFAGTLAATSVKGRLALGLQTPLRVDGRIEADSVDGSVMLTTLLGVPAPAIKNDAAKGEAAWSGEPFGPAVDIVGQLEFATKRTTFAPAVTFRQLRGSLRLARSEMELTELEGEIGGGRLSGQVLVRTGPGGLNARSTLRLTSADLLALLPAEINRNALSGRAAVQLDVEGSGLSPAAFIGSVGGNGTIVLEDLRIGALDTRAFESVIKAVDQGLAMDTVRVQGAVTSALDKGSLVIPWAEGTFSIAGGQIRLGTTLAPAQGADVNLSGRYELVSGALNLRLALTGPPKPPTPERPEIVVAYRGPMAAPERSVDVSTFSTWLALRSVEQQAKHLEALETRRREALAATPPAPEAAPPSRPAPAGLTPSSGAESAPPASEATAPLSGGAAISVSPETPVAPNKPLGAAGSEPLLRPTPPVPPPVIVRATPRPPRQIEAAPSGTPLLPRPRPQQRPAPPSAAIVMPNVSPAVPQQPAPDNRSFFERLFSPQQLQN
jgi:large subunit ribosomal protein L24